MTTGIYKITNLVNGKVYIGASKNIEKRWSEHRGNVKSPIHSDLEVLGEENFRFEVLIECPEAMLAQWERDMICLYDSDDPEKGYNSPKDRPYNPKVSESLKGRSVWNKGRSGIFHSEETKSKISKKMKGHIGWNKGILHSNEAKRKMSESHKGQKAWNKGILLSDETRRKMSEAKKEYWKKKKEV